MVYSAKEATFFIDDVINRNIQQELSCLAKELDVILPTDKLLFNLKHVETHHDVNWYFENRGGYTQFKQYLETVAKIVLSIELKPEHLEKISFIYTDILSEEAILSHVITPIKRVIQYLMFTILLQEDCVAENILNIKHMTAFDGERLKSEMFTYFKQIGYKLFGSSVYTAIPHRFSSHGAFWNINHFLSNAVVPLIKIILSENSILSRDETSYFLIRRAFNSLKRDTAICLLQLPYKI